MTEQQSAGVVAHTPGPWTLEIGEMDYLDGIRSGLTIRQANGAPVAYAFDAAEARLIAAAPELLEALRIARRYVADLPIVGDADLAIIDEAIAKATGVSQ